MAITVKPKSFGPVYVSYDSSGQLTYAYKDMADSSPHPPAQTPVDTLIASLGACIVKSVEMCANQNNVSLNPFTVKVVGTKSTTLPGRVATMDATVIGRVVDDAELAEKILKKAKSICTVSNSLNSEVTLASEPA